MHCETNRWPALCALLPVALRRSAPRSTALLFTALLFSTLLLTALGAPAARADARQVYTQGSPHWLAAVGQLAVPGHRDGTRSHVINTCSATLLTRKGRSSADLIATAWHCLEHYSDLSRPIVFTLPGATGAPITREAHRVADGGGMDADWALLRLRPAVSLQQNAAIGLHPSQPDASRSVLMAGYSRDAGLGAQGARLTFDPSCRITGQNRRHGDTDCTAFRGASGGAVIQLAADGTPLWSGIISEGDGETISRFVQVETLRPALALHLR